MSRDENEKIPTSRVRRTATVATLAASEAVKQFGTRAANVTRDEDAAVEAMSRRQLETAKQIVAVLGTMKGAAMKLGQVMSFLDVGLVPEEHREEFQAELAKLRDAAPTVSFKQMRKVIEEDLEDDLEEFFSEFDPEPIAAASIGQVYRARLASDGREVAVKVQYPGVAGAVRADMQNLDMIMRLLKRMAPGPRREGGDEGDPRAHRGGARLRARGAEPACSRTDLRGAPLHRRAGGRQLALPRAGARERLRDRRGLRDAQGGHA